MDVDLDPSAGLTLSFATEEELEEFLDEVRTRSAFLAPLPTELALYAAVEVTLRCGAETRGEAKAEVVQVFPDGGDGYRTAFQLRADSLVVRTPPPAGSGEMMGSSPIFEIKSLNPSQKARLAVRAGRTERQILLRDTSPQVLQGLLINPRLEAKEVLQIVKSTHVNAAILQRVASDARWGQNQEILACVARNPKTAVPFATRLIEKLRTSDLRLMAKMQSGMREVLRKAALREYLRRTSKR